MPYAAEWRIDKSAAAALVSDACRKCAIFFYLWHHFSSQISRGNPGIPRPDLLEASPQEIARGAPLVGTPGGSGGSPQDEEGDTRGDFRGDRRPRGNQTGESPWVSPGAGGDPLGESDEGILGGIPGWGFSGDPQGDPLGNPLGGFPDGFYVGTRWGDSQEGLHFGGPATYATCCLCLTRGTPYYAT